MTGLSPRKLKYMRAFAEAWPDPPIVQQLVAQLPWGHNIRLLEAFKQPEARLVRDPGRRARLEPRRPDPPDRRTAHRPRWQGADEFCPNPAQRGRSNGHIATTTPMEGLVASPIAEADSERARLLHRPVSEAQPERTPTLGPI